MLEGANVPEPWYQSLTSHSLYQYNVDVCCLSEVRIPNSGSLEIKILGANSHFTLYHSGPRDFAGRHDETIALSQQANRALLAWEPVNERMAYARSKGDFQNISIISVKCLWTQRDISIDTKIRIYRVSVQSVLVYGCECWATRIEDERKFEAFDHHCLRTILRVKYKDFVSNETVHNRCANIARISQAIQELRLSWLGRVLHRPPYEFSVTALEPTPLPNWRHRRGGQLKIWLDTVRQDMEVVLGPSVFGIRRWRRE
ncbi:unnamed protein product [Schistocephalus solidus]|uniref:Uncharacterized protein n=1 Tax=Schistocephalus solidus TaxID=70667 RepID=A0A183TJC9_SCHSO|nr:unnamed protein product [Schistocephalus solidus]